MIRTLFFVFTAFALLGDLRIFLFILNRVVWGNHKDEKSPWQWLIYVLPPLLVVLTALFWPLNTWVDRLMATSIAERVVPERLEDIAWSIALAKIGIAWLMIAGAVGIQWIVERVHVLTMPAVSLIGVRTAPSDLVALRRA